MSNQLKFEQLRRIALQQLRGLQLAGLQQLPAPPGKHRFASWLTDVVEDRSTPANLAPQVEPQPVVVREAKSQDPLKIPGRNLASYRGASLEPAERIRQLAIMQQTVAQCRLCPDLCESRKNTVFGDGNPQPRLCFVGEGPGADEDRQGIPFVGPAGQLLNKIIEACNMQRSEVYILNTVKCRPPGNRNPNESELQNCWPYGIRQLELLQPEFICCLGSIAARTVLQTNESIGRLRGRFFQYRGSRVIATYHPAYLLRNPSAKKQVWEDMQTLLRALGREI